MSGLCHFEPGPFLNTSALIPAATTHICHVDLKEIVTLEYAWYDGLISDKREVGEKKIRDNEQV